jgi:thiaminase/transcriptional activator TenA
MNESLAFSTSAWQRNEGIYQSILAMPFNQELMNGTLSKDRFQHYMIQDAHYLEGFARALALVAARGFTAEHVIHFAGAAQTAIVVERALHGDYFRQFEISPESFATSEPTPTCEHYVSYLLRISALESFPVALAGLLPCFWIYREVGHHISQRSAPDNPWQAWVDTYAGTEFDDAVNAVIQIVDTIATEASSRELAGMHQAFQRATQLEWMFWDSAYRLTAWPI